MEPRRGGDPSKPADYSPLPVPKPPIEQDHAKPGYTTREFQGFRVARGVSASARQGLKYDVCDDPASLKHEAPQADPCASR